MDIFQFAPFISHWKLFYFTIIRNEKVICEKQLSGLVNKQTAGSAEKTYRVKIAQSQQRPLDNQ